MNELYDRTGRLVGAGGVEKLKNAKVLIVGLGGVGGYIAESLARAGVGTIGVCDFDVVDPTNLNRQILAVSDTIGQKKTEAAENRIKSINPECKVIKYDFRLNTSKLTELNIPCWDYIADAIDDSGAKIALMKAACENNIPMISCMGTGRKLDPFSFKLSTLNKTEGDPLARSLRKKAKDAGIDAKLINVLYSTENSAVLQTSAEDEKSSEDFAGKEPIASISYMPAVAGLEISAFIIQNILK